MTVNPVINPTTLQLNHQSRLPLPFSIVGARWVFFLTIAKHSVVYPVDARGKQSGFIYNSSNIRSSSFLVDAESSPQQGTNIGKFNYYRRKPTKNAKKSYPESKQAVLYFKMHIRSSKKPSIFYSKLFLKKWVSSTKPLGGFEPDLNGFFTKALKISISSAPVRVEVESNCSKTPLNCPFSRGITTI